MSKLCISKKRTAPIEATVVFFVELLEVHGLGIVNAVFPHGHHWLGMLGAKLMYIDNTEFSRKCKSQSILFKSRDRHPYGIGLPALWAEAISEIGLIGKQTTANSAILHCKHSFWERESASHTHVMDSIWFYLTFARLVIYEKRLRHTKKKSQFLTRYPNI